MTDAAEAELDRQYGILLPPQGDGVRIWEKTERKERSELDQSFADDLRVICQQASEMPALRDVLTALIYIWAADSVGRIFISPQLAFDSSDPKRLFPVPRGLPRVSTLRLLGHPILVGGQPARISGELYLDWTNDGSLTWVIDNQSGRYGMHRSRSEEHLLNVQRRFRQLGVEVAVDFIPPS